MFRIDEDHPLLRVPMSNKVEDRINGPSNLPSDEDWNPDALDRWSAHGSQQTQLTLNFEKQSDDISLMAPMTPYLLSDRSYRNLEGVNSRLQVVIGTAIQFSPYDFIVIEGLRTKQRQFELVQKGASRTMNSRHLTGHAVDLAIWHEGKVDWDFEKYEILNEHIQKIAKQHGTQITWGGSWQFMDGPHFELTWNT